MTADEFERQYAERTGRSLNQLRKYCVVRPCNCGENSCQGWQSMSHERAAEFDLALSMNPDSEDEIERDVLLHSARVVAESN